VQKGQPQKAMVTVFAPMRWSGGVQPQSGTPVALCGHRAIR
jgi:hypothetical protein